MALKKYKPTTPGRRGMTALQNEEITTNKPEKSLLVRKIKTGGRNNRGVITVRHRGGGHKQMYRIIDFKRDKYDIPGKIATIEYDPNRSANIALVNYADGEKRYIIAPEKIKVGDEIISGENVDVKIGNSMPLKNIPEGTLIHSIQLQPNKKAQLARSAGSSARILGKEGGYVTVRLKSKEVRKILGECRATIGEVGNEEHSLINYGKAGRKRWLGIKPTVRGSVMNPNDHPHGGGEGKAPVGYDAPRTPWGKKALGVKTRNKKKPSSKYIIRRRKSK